MRPPEPAPSDSQKQHVTERGYRSFLQTNDDNSQTLIQVFAGSHLLQIAHRADPWSTWSAPSYMEEIFE